LQEEFPDVTISKIRFLESQGLVDPERTPSGYRKFYEPDIDRLRWVLRQQRDAFLPLKVIKGRLDEQGELAYDDDEAYDGDEEGPAGTGPALIEIVEERLVVQAHAGGPAPPRPAAGARSGATQDATPAATAGATAGATGAAPPPESAPGHHNGAGQAGPMARKNRPDADRTVGRPPVVTEPLFDAGPPFSPFEAPAEPGRAPRRPAPEEGARGRGEAATAKAPAGRAGQIPGRGPSAPPRSSRPGRSLAAPPAPGEDDLTLEELVSEPGIDVGTVRDLERFGLITPKFVGSVAYYSQEAAVIVELASAFARHGVEARHLRAYKGAAEREAGMVQQVIMPLIRQRNPEAREAAAQAVEELSHLGGELRAVLLRAALADLH
jgi:DNA-binding transcriptional MerR regulator